jgi:hypothetical protein
MQELMRHSTIRVTLDTYTQAVTTEKRAAQTAVVRLFVGKKGSKPPQEETGARFGRPAGDADSRC